MALNPGADVDRRMLVAVLIRFAELVMQLKRRGQRGKGDQGQPQDREQQIKGKSSYVGFHERMHSSNAGML